MMLRSSFFCFCVIVVCLMAQAQSGNPAEEKLVRINAEKIFSVTRITRPIALFDGASDVSVPGKGIFISRLRLHRLLPDSSFIDKDLVIQFLVAHELAHQIQFDRYTKDLKGSSCELKRLFECQADILAGIFLSNAYNLRSRIAEDADKHRDLLGTVDYVYSIGDEEYNPIQHPTASERRMAFRLGLAWPLVTAAVKRDPNIPAREAIDYREGEDSISWSKRISAYIIHYPNSVNRNILFRPTYIDEKDKDNVVWDTSQANPYVIYKVGKFVNRNPFPVELFLQSRLIGVPRNSSLGILKAPALQGGSKNSRVQLAPGDSVIVDGRLSWRGLAWSEYMPRLLHPPGPETLYTAEPIGATAPAEEPGCSLEIAQAATADHPDGGLIMALLEARRYAKDNFEPLEKGFGKDLGDEEIEYAAHLDYPGSLQIREYGSDHTTTLEIELYNGHNPVQADSAFKKGMSALSYLACAGTFKIRRDYQDLYSDEDPDSVITSASSIRHSTHRFGGDSVLITTSKYGSYKKMEGIYPIDGIRIYLSCDRLFRPSGSTYMVELSITTKKRDEL